LPCRSAIYAAACRRRYTLRFRVHTPILILSFRLFRFSFIFAVASGPPLVAAAASEPEFFSERLLSAELAFPPPCRLPPPFSGRRRRRRRRAADIRRA